jgi:hypothetical protein
MAKKKPAKKKSPAKAKKPAKKKMTFKSKKKPKPKVKAPVKRASAADRKDGIPDHGVSQPIVTFRPREACEWFRCQKFAQCSAGEGDVSKGALPPSLQYQTIRSRCEADNEATRLVFKCASFVPPSS